VCVRSRTMLESALSGPFESLTMTRRFLLPVLAVALTLTALLATSAPAGAAQLYLVGGASFGSPSLYPYQQWAVESYAPTYRGAVQLAFSPAVFTCGAAAVAVGCTSWPEWPVPLVKVYTGQGPYWAHQYLMHELGHVFDETELQDPDRAEFMAIWGLPGGAGAWWTPFASGDGNAGEWFAESYRLCALYGPQMPYAAWTVDWPTFAFPGDRDTAQQDASCRLILQVGAADGLLTPPSPTVYVPRVLVRSNRKVAECRGQDLLLLGNQVRCETMSGESPSGPWSVTLQSRRMSKTELLRARLVVANGQPAFAFVRRSAPRATFQQAA
jgi:hypothetical protein